VKSLRKWKRCWINYIAPAVRDFPTDAVEVTPRTFLDGDGLLRFVFKFKCPRCGRPQRRDEVCSVGERFSFVLYELVCCGQQVTVAMPWANRTGRPRKGQQSKEEG
jgi:hypothetical protein